MSNILLLYDYTLSHNDNEKMPLAGTQTAFIGLVNAFKELGHHVTVLTKTNERKEDRNLFWGDLSESIEQIHYDLMIVNVSPWLFEKFKYVKAAKRVLWVHNEAKYLLFWKRYKYILKYWPIIVFSGKYHRSTFPWFIPSPAKKIIYLGLSNYIFSIKKNNFSSDKNKKVFFTSNPLRSLDWLIDIWVYEIHPNVPDAELHIFSSWKTYGNWGLKLKARMEKIMDYVLLHKEQNIYLREPLPKNELFDEMKTGRAFFYKGDKSETFCLAVAEAQALGLPAVVYDIASMKERVLDGVTGFVAKTEKDFVNKCKLILTDNDCWNLLSEKATLHGADFTWVKSAESFLKL